MPRPDARPTRASRPATLAFGWAVAAVASAAMHLGLGAYLVGRALAGTRYVRLGGALLVAGTVAPLVIAARLPLGRRKRHHPE